MKRKQLLWNLLAVAAVVGLLFVPIAVAAEDQSISGTLMESDQGIVLSTDDGEIYNVAGQDVSDMVGKYVRVTGTLTEDETGRTITVVGIEEINNE
jgi:hypothetical protein